MTSGVEKITLVSRSGGDPPKEIAHQCEVVRMDCSDEKNVQRLLKDRTITGIIHCAGVLRDGFFKNQTEENYELVYCKAKMAHWLDVYSRHLALECFVMYSSLSSLMGSAGQSNYSTANCMMDRIVERRNELGLVGCSIQWSGWSIGGMAEERTLSAMKREGLVPINEFIGDGFLNAKITTEGIWGCIPQQEASTKVKPEGTKSIKFKTEEEILEEIIRITKMIINREVSVTEPLMDAGIDSLSSVEFTNALKNSFGFISDNSILFNYPTIEKIKGFLMDHNLDLADDYETSYEIVDEQDDGSIIVDNLTLENSYGKIEWMGRFTFPNKKALETILKKEVSIENENIVLKGKSQFATSGSGINRSCIVTYYQFMEAEKDPKEIETIRKNMQEYFVEKNVFLLDYEASCGRVKLFMDSFSNLYIH